jgi:hypothetical protein
MMLDHHTELYKSSGEYHFVEILKDMLKQNKEETTKKCS